MDILIIYSRNNVKYDILISSIIVFAILPPAPSPSFVLNFTLKKITPLCRACTAVLLTRGPINTKNSVFVAQMTKARNVVAYYSKYKDLYKENGRNSIVAVVKRSV